jgi:hypothetical protein
LVQRPRFAGIIEVLATEYPIAFDFADHRPCGDLHRCAVAGLTQLGARLRCFRAARRRRDRYERYNSGKNPLHITAASFRIGAFEVVY